MLKTLQSLLLLLALGLFQASAQTNIPAGKRPANRYLLVVETSRSMQHRTNGLWQAVQQLVASGMSGQMHRGDSLGLWLYNERLQAGVFPLQEWSADAPRTVPARVLGFLRAQPYEKPAHFDAVLPAWQQVVQKSEFLTTVLFLTGEEELQGLPCADKINEYCKAWQKQQQAAQMPFVVVLRSQGGKLVDYSLNSPPWPVELPALPTELTQVADGNKTAPVPTAAPAPVAAPAPAPKVKVLPPLILSGKEPEAVPTSKPIPAVSETPGPVARAVELAPQPILPPATNSQGAPQAALTAAIASNPESAPVSKAVAELPPSSSPEATSPAPGDPPVQMEGSSAPRSDVVRPSASVATTAKEPLASTPATARGARPVPPAAATATATGAGLNHLVALAVGGGVLLMVGAGLWWWRSRARKPQHVSLITQSLNQCKRP